MFHALSKKPDYWDSKMNLFVSLAPVTQLKNTSSALFKFGSNAAGLVEDVTNLLGIYTILGPLSSTATRLVCSAVVGLCKLVEGFLITHDPKLDDTDRF